jgi:alcohol-forming fatty acyl-CoA reductase
MDEKPEVMDKIYPVWGDCSKLDFDLSVEHLKRVIETTEIVFHMAASLKMEAPLKPNVLINLTGTKYALDVAKRMKNLIQMVHLSTAFCNVNEKITYEKVYENPHNPDDLIRMAEWMSDEAMASMQKELLGLHPNTYTYTKHLAEIMVQREFENGMPITIVRPTVVMPSLSDPIPGWVDSLNGVVGIFYAAGKGVLRSMMANPDSQIEIIPVDIAINAIVLIPKLLASTERSIDIPVYHLTVLERQKLKMKETFDLIKEIGRKYPCSWALWYPDGGMTMNKYENKIKVFLFQLIPAYLIDFLLFCFRQKRL